MLNQYCTPERNIGGLLETPIAGDAIDGVNVILTNIGGGNESLTYADEPSYYDVAAPTSNFGVIAKKSDNATCGVSTADLIIIQKALLGTEDFTHASELIAADVNNSGSVTTLDMIRIRRVILNPSTVNSNFYRMWEFIPTNEYLNLSVSSSNPLQVPSYDSEHQVPLGSNDVYGLGFVGVKIGDVNDNCISGGRPAPMGIDQEATALTILEQALKQGEDHLIPVYCGDFEEETLLSLSFSTSTALQLLDVVPAALKDIDETAFHINKAGDELRLIWFPHDNEAQTIAADEPLFYLKVQAQTDVSRLSQVLSLNSSEENNKYNQGGEVSSLRLSTVAKLPALAVELKKMNWNVYPNPLGNGLPYQLSFTAEYSQLANLELFNSSGQLIYQQQLSLEKGFNSWNLDALQTQTAGLYYQRIRTADQTITIPIVHQ